MSKTSKILFAIFNVILFSTNFIFVVYLPKTLLFGWLPSQLAFFIGSMVAASIVWGLYFNKFLDTQEHVNQMYKDK